MKSSVSFNLYDQIITQAKTRKNIHVFKWYNQLHLLSYLEDLLHLTYVYWRNIFNICSHASKIILYKLRYCHNLVY